MKVSDKQIAEWQENPVTLALKEQCREKLKEIDSEPISDALVFGSPQTTQERLIKNLWRALGCTNTISLLEGDWSEMELDDEE